MHTNHKNLTNRPFHFATQQIVQWQLPLEKFGPTFVHKKGGQNCIVDALSQVPTKNKDVTLAVLETQCFKVDDLLTECPWAVPKFNEQNCHLFHFETIAHCQSLNNDLMNSPTTVPCEFVFQKFGSCDLV